MLQIGLSEGIKREDAIRAAGLSISKFLGEKAECNNYCAFFLRSFLIADDDSIVYRKGCSFEGISKREDATMIVLAYFPCFLRPGTKWGKGGLSNFKYFFQQIVGKDGDVLVRKIE